MIDVQSVACTATFMFDGMLAADVEHRTMGADGRYDYDMYGVWNQGGLELHLEMCQYAELAEKICQFISADEGYQFPGVFDYEVSTEFGKWFIEYLFEHSDAPSKVIATDKLITMTAHFFSQDADKAVQSFEAGILFAKIKEHLK